MRADLVPLFVYLFDVLGVFFRPELDHKEGRAHVLTLQHFQKRVGIVRSPCAVEGNGDFFLFRFHRIDRKFAHRAARKYGVRARRREQYAQNDCKRRRGKKKRRRLFFKNENFHSLPPILQKSAGQNLYACDAKRYVLSKSPRPLSCNLFIFFRLARYARMHEKTRGTNRARNNKPSKTRKSPRAALPRGGLFLLRFYFQ